MKVKGGIMTLLSLLSVLPINQEIDIFCGDTNETIFTGKLSELKGVIKQAILITQYTIFTPYTTMTYFMYQLQK